jgi:hypothetical protein
VAVYAPIVIAAGSLANLLFAAMFTARVVAPGWAHLLGLSGTAMALPLLGASVIAWQHHLSAWEIGLPLVFVAFALVELAVDTVFRLDVRHTAWLWPYLLSFYLAQWAVIGAGFRVSRVGGFVLLATYFVCLAATAYSYRSVGHGPA